MEIDRDLQKKILETLASSYPRWKSRKSLVWLDEDKDEEKVIAQLFYLAEHGLVRCESEILQYLDDKQPRISGKDRNTITAKGLDFLADDGGLSAILSVQTIKIHDETIKTILASKIDSLNLTREEKEGYIAKLRDMPADAVKHLIFKMLDAGFDNAEKVGQVLVKIFSGS